MTKRHTKSMVMELKRVGALVLAAVLMTGCTLTPNRAPIVERGLAGRAPAIGAAASGVAVGAEPVPVAGVPVEIAAPLPGAENSGKPGYYTVRTGDTVLRIGLETGQNAKDLIKWNNLENPNVIEVGQVLRVWPPGVDPAAAASRPVNAARVETRPLDNKSEVTGTGAAAGSAPAPVAAPAATPAPATATAPSREGDEDVNWAWPAAGPVIAPFEEGKVKGLSIRGRAGDPVLAAADGRVVYAGSGLRGYGNLIILKHNSTYLTAYAHNQTLLVKEDQSVRRGQKIAEMGATDADSVKLHFEIRKLGKPIDPAKLLPPR
ncbi:MAG: peptidoglycan DD-metalloendopeptidase family protein [Burkholderiaceae bacterium]